MQSDDLIWSIIKDKGFCSFKAKLPHEKQTFCRSPDNITGLCCRQSCPLANARYATIKEFNGTCYLYMKTVERAHTPSKLWERIALPKNNFAESCSIIDKELQFWPSYIRNKCKLRLTKIHQYLIRMKKLRMETKPALVPIKQKSERRERKKEDKPLKAAHIEKGIEKELLERLKQGTYAGIYNFPEAVFEKALNDVNAEADVDEDDEEEEMEDEEEMEGEEKNLAIEYVEGDDEDDDDDMEDFAPLNDDDNDEEEEDNHGNGDDEGSDDDDEIETTKKTGKRRREKEEKPKDTTEKKMTKKTKKKKTTPLRRGPYVEVEYEDEEEEQKQKR